MWDILFILFLCIGSIVLLITFVKSILSFNVYKVINWIFWFVIFCDIAYVLFLVMESDTTKAIKGVPEKKISVIYELGEKDYENMAVNKIDYSI